MDFKEAHGKLQEIANGQYNHIGYKVTTLRPSELEQECRLYIHPSILVDGKSWEDAFNKLDNVLNPKSAPEIIIDIIPEMIK